MIVSKPERDAPANAAQPDQPIWVRAVTLQGGEHMPTYDYKCEQCGHFEYHQSIKDEPLAKCPTCQGAVRRLISNNVNIIFKGSGFHITDYRSKSYTEKANRDNGGSSSSEGSGAKSEVASASSDA